jgi:histidinol-phosphatase (PHP family)
MLADYHLHTPLCLHAEGHPRKYAAQALTSGLAEIGFSDHNPMPEYFDDWRMPIADFPRYLDMVEEARANFPALPIRLALECDYLEGREAWTDEQANSADFDYLIGSVHYIAPGWDVDNPKHLSRWRDAGAVEEIWSRYWKLYAQMIRRQQFDFYAHPDLPKKFGLRPCGDLRPYYEDTIQALADTNGVIEVSTAGLRKDCREMYPSREFLDMAFAAKIPIVISSDSHAPGEVGIHFDQALSFVREVGYRSSVRFRKRQRIEVPLPETWPVAS